MSGSESAPTRRDVAVYRADSYLALTKLVNADKPAKKQQMMRPCGGKGNETCGLISGAAYLYCRAQAHTRTLAGAPYWGSAPP
jgi:hypothetical protein